MKYNYILIALLVLAMSCNTDEAPVVSYDEVVDSIKQQYAPDKRVAIFGVEAVQQGENILIKGESNQAEAVAALKKALASKGTVVDSVLLLPNMEGNNYGVVNLSVCNIRSKPKHSAELSTQALLGTVLNVYKKEGDWYLVQTPDQYLGWLDEKAFVLMDEAQKNEWVQAPKVIYLADFGMSTNAEGKPVSDLLRGDMLMGTIADDNYVEVVYPDQRIAKVHQSELMNYEEWKSTRQLSEQNVLAAARQYLGRPYLWGGTSGKGMDCSGFTKTVFEENGFMLPRDASQQVHIGELVETDTTLVNLEKGDLLFFGREATADQKEKIWHVAIYLGDGEIIHATGAVCIESLKRGAPHFVEERLQTLVRARRLL